MTHDAKRNASPIQGTKEEPKQNTSSVFPIKTDAPRNPHRISDNYVHPCVDSNPKPKLYDLKKPRPPVELKPMTKDYKEIKNLQSIPMTREDLDRLDDDGAPVEGDYIMPKPEEVQIIEDKDAKDRPPCEIKVPPAEMGNAVLDNRRIMLEETDNE